MKVHQFSRVKDLFKDFIDQLYELKKIATLSKDPIKKLIAKLHLNTLYGMFGRKLDAFTCIACSPSEQLDILSKYPVKSIIKINKLLSIFLVHSNVDFSLIKQANADLNINLIKQRTQFVKSNVAIKKQILSCLVEALVKVLNLPGNRTNESLKMIVPFFLEVISQDNGIAIILPSFIMVLLGPFEEIIRNKKIPSNLLKLLA